MTCFQWKGNKYWIQILESNQEANVMTKHGLIFENQLRSLKHLFMKMNSKLN